MKSIIIHLPSSLIKQEEQESLHFENKRNQSQIKISEKMVKRPCYYKDEQSTTSSKSIISQKSITSKIIQLNEVSTACHSQIGQQDDSFNHYAHYLSHFQNGILQNQEKEAGVAYLPLRKQAKLSIMPYAKLVSSIGEANIEKKNDKFIQEWIDFMENYDCEKIGLNLLNRQQNINGNNSFNKYNNLNCNDNEKRFQHLTKKNQKILSKQTNQVNIRDIVTQFTIPEVLEELILNKFCLYIQSQYKILKTNDLEKQLSSIDQQMYGLIYNNQNNASSLMYDTSCSSATHSSQFNGSNTSTTKKITEIESSDSLKEQKKYHFNMSKYFMLLLLELFREEHLGALESLPEAIIGDITSVVNLIQQISKKNNSSKTNYYNHYHYDTLFLQINEQTKNSILRNQKLLEMHQKVFRISDLTCQLSIQRINIIKQYMAQIVLSQLAVLKKKIQLITKQTNISKSTLEDVNSKIDYLYRVEQGIIELNLGKTINRF